jgi:hypothetical protein
MELDIQNLFWVHVHSLTETPPPAHSPGFGLIYEGAIGQPR